jgi:hypothetical protein
MMMRRLLACSFVLLLTAGCSESFNPIPPPPPPLGSQNVLRLADAEGTPGSSVQLVLSLENPTALTALQFDLSLDPDVLTPVAVTATARSAGFDVREHAAGGTVRVVLVDLDGSAVIAAGDGPVANVTVTVATSAAAGATPLLVDQATAVDAIATTLSVGGSAATFNVR